MRWQRARVFIAPADAMRMPQALDAGEQRSAAGDDGRGRAERGGDVRWATPEEVDELWAEDDWESY